MNISYSWLKDLIPIDLSAAELAEKLTRVGLAVEGVHSYHDDFVFDIDLTSNRPDCLSHLGVAREIGVIAGTKVFEKARTTSVEADVPLPAILAPDIVRIEEPALCHRFTARIIRNVKIAPSPEFLVKRLEAIGERSINNVADVTNYVMHELGQPMHAFDLNGLAEKRIVVRRAKADETITTLDDVERRLDDTMLVIGDAEKPAAIGGIMGGLDTSINESTVDVLLEVAFFKRENIRQTSRKLGLTTEASYRFERGVDIDNLKAASDRAAEMIREVAGGELGEFIDVYPTKHGKTTIEAPDIAAAVTRLTGLTVAKNDCLRILQALGIEADDPSRPTLFTSPSWRHDLAIEEDLVEEVARHTGYEKIGNELPPAYGAGEYQVAEVRKKLMRLSLSDLGFDEAISYSFIDTKFDGQFEPVPGLVNNGAREKIITLRHSVIEGAVRMRPTLLPGLLEAIRLNLNHQRRDLRLFEIGKVFAASSGEDILPIEREVFSLVLTGGDVLKKRLLSPRTLDFYDAKGAVEAALEAVGFESLEFRSSDATHLRPGQAATVYIDGGCIGTVGRLNEQISADYKFRNPVYLAEIDLDAVFSRNAQPVAYRPLHKFPSIIRDVTFLVDRATTFDDIRTAVIDYGSEICCNVGFVDIFESQDVDEGKRSLTIRLEYRSDERTLLDDEVTVVHDNILQSLRDTLNVEPKL